MTDRWVVALAVGVWCAAILQPGAPLLLGLVVTIGALVVRNPWLLLVGCVLVAGRPSPAPDPVLTAAVTEDYVGIVALTGDPERVRGGTVADATWPGGTGRVWAFGGVGAALAKGQAGERLEVLGRVVATPASLRLEVDTIVRWRSAPLVARAANRVRVTLASGASSLSRQHRSLFAGLVLGDDRDQSPELADDFRGSGLTHLLAVSGQNVAFVLVVTGPLLRRVPIGARWAITIAILLFFAVLTRFEPSVVRATAMAILAVTGRELGLRASPLRLLALAVTGVVLIQPSIVTELAFQLSVAASGGIVTMAARLADRLPGFGLLREAMAVTIAAQLAVAPLLIATFGPIPIASLPANILAGPAAGAVMMWGLTGGMLAGLVGGSTASLLHVPTRLLLVWLERVAAGGATSGLGALGIGGTLACGLLLAGAVAGRHRAIRRGATALLVGLLVVVALSPAGVGTRQLAGGSMLHRSGGAVVLAVTATERLSTLLDLLRRDEVRRIDLVIVEDGSVVAAEQLAAVRARAGVGSVWGPPGHRLDGVVGVEPGTTARVGDLLVVVETFEPTLRVGIGQSLPSR